MKTDMQSIFGNYFTGINYWCSENATQMWKDYDPVCVENDFKTMAEHGLTHLRVFPLWSDFQPLHALYATSGVYEYRFGEQPLPDTEAGKAGVSQEACGYFEHLCNTAQKYGIKLIVALVTGQMSFRVFYPPAFEGKNPVTDPTATKWILRFIKYFVTRFKDNPAIAGWDLGNEVNTLTSSPSNVSSTDFHPDTFWVWCTAIANTVRMCDPVHPVISGMCNSNIEKGHSNLKAIGEFCDIHTTHPYNIFSTATDPLCSMKPILDLPFKCRLGEDIAGIPTFVQEFGSIGYATCSKKTEAQFYRAALLSTLAHNAHGVMWWCAFDQGHLRFAPYDWNNIGSDYGFFDKNRTPKPIAEENLRFKNELSELFRKLPERKLPQYKHEATVIVPRDDGDADLDTLRASYMLAKKANFDVSFSYALDPIPDSPLYIFPSLNAHKSILAHRLDELLQKVKDGSTLYVSLGYALFRQLPEIFGVNIDARKCSPSLRKMDFDGTLLPVTSCQTLYTESVDKDTQVLAYDADGNPMFFKRKYGKGTLYLLTAPLERYLAGKDGAFHTQDVHPYENIYRELAVNAGIDKCRVADTDSPFVRLTEHPLSDGTTAVFAINYSDRKVTATVKTEGTILPEALLGNAPDSDGKITLDPCDGVVFRVRNQTCKE